MLRVLIPSLVVVLQVSAVITSGDATFPRLSAAMSAARLSLFAGDDRPDSLRCDAGTAIADPSSDLPTPATSGGRFAPRWRSAPLPLVVQAEDGSALVGWSPRYRSELAAAFGQWEQAGAPVKFRIVSDGGPGDIHVRWVDKFGAHYDGWTTVRWDVDGWIVSADLTLSVRDSRGRTLSKLGRQQVMLHEVGHLLGLAHSSWASSIMRSEVKATAIADIDRVSLASLYSATERTGFASSERPANAPQGRCGQSNGGVAR